MRSFFTPIRTALLVLSLMTVGILAITWPTEAAAQQDWSTVAGPVEGEPRIIGHHGGACLIGAQQLPEEGTGYQAVDLERRRHYGHPSLLDYIQVLGQRVEEAGFGPILVGDMAQPRGGPMSYGHVSHQSGLDVDIWFRLDLPALERSRREKLDQPILVDPETGRMDPERWTDRHAQLIHLAAMDDRVARIFVDAAVKQDLCERSWEDRSWLRRIRPWPAHDEHLHVRLRCPENSAECVDQSAPPPGEGCDNIQPTPRVARESSPSRTVPAACEAVLEQ
ncbi:penicillin-insensitive murein endopeptidase [Pseudomonas sp. gcc21]|uniref:penicillin-insensitive murein endopeptidase n=1 Tax=Pseudomonas sp. gcc21 TaxID=2726989 RepID=UPI0014521B9D|nr:penicillin-insensitive murein endopeptidase [Pseudomonas sp. gcc21]QJD59712.1 penicillin-insensitive murein endopeptidase [Pseudomonas sp. gcc21]